MNNTRAPLPALSGKATAILAMIASGNAYEQILRAYPDFTYNDIFDAADEALQFSEGRRVPSGEVHHEDKAYSVDAVRERFPRAYQAWDEQEEQQLRELINSGHTVAQIAGRLQRQRSAIRSRITRLGLTGMLTPKEQERLARIAHRTGHPVLPEGGHDD